MCALVKCVHVYACVSVFVCLCVCACVRACVRACVCVCVNIVICMCCVCCYTSDMSNEDYHTHTSHHTTACMYEASVLILLVVYYMATHTERETFLIRTEYIQC